MKRSRSKKEKKLKDEKKEENQNQKGAGGEEAGETTDDKVKDTGAEKIEIERENPKEEFTQESEEKAINDLVNSYESELGILIEKINNLEHEKNELNDLLMRRSADFENFKKRSENEQMNLLKFAAEPFIIKILGVYDDLSRALDHMGEEKNIESIDKGLRLIFDKFSKVLEEQGVKRIESKGKQFDFNYHEALMQQPSNDVPPHTILDEVEPGYVYKDKVIRHAKVIVSQQAVAEDDKQDENPGNDSSTNNEN
jgi:molecular chaperone GrpE